jgi:hypothetical protein
MLVDDIRDADLDVPGGAGMADTWWIESRGSWAVIQSRDVVFPIRTDVVDITRSGIIRQGNQLIYSGKSKAQEISRTITCSQTGTGVVNYRFPSAVGLQTSRILATNNTNPDVQLKWHGALDGMLDGILDGVRLLNADVRNVDFGVRYDTADGLGRFAHMNAFAGLTGGF